MATPRAEDHPRTAPESLSPSLRIRHWIARTALTLALVATGVTAHPANAGSLYSEVTGGVSAFQSSGNFFGGGSPGGSGLALGGGLYGSLMQLGPGMELQGGLAARLNSGSDSANSYQLLTAMPMLRIQMWNFSIGGGVTPFVWRRTGSGIGIDGITAPDSRLSYAAEFAALWPVVPIFSLGLSGTAEWVRSADGLGPAPAYSAAFLMRFYLTFWQSKGGGGSSSGSLEELRGWRYPFGYLR